MKNPPMRMLFTPKGMPQKIGQFAKPRSAMIPVFSGQPTVGTNSHGIANSGMTNTLKWLDVTGVTIFINHSGCHKTIQPQGVSPATQLRVQFCRLQNSVRKHLCIYLSVLAATVTEVSASFTCIDTKNTIHLIFYISYVHINRYTHTAETNPTKASFCNRETTGQRGKTKLCMHK